MIYTDVAYNGHVCDSYSCKSQFTLCANEKSCIVTRYCQYVFYLGIGLMTLMPFLLMILFLLGEALASETLGPLHFSKTNLSLELSLKDPRSFVYFLRS